jgi:hypothetical protein
MKAQALLLICFQRTLRATEFLLLRLPRVAGWLRQKLQADSQKQKILDKP